jgi:hypothetical protein
MSTKLTTSVLLVLAVSVNVASAQPLTQVQFNSVSVIERKIDYFGNPIITVVGWGRVIPNSTSAYPGVGMGGFSTPIMANIFQSTDETQQCAQWAESAVANPNLSLEMSGEGVVLSGTAEFALNPLSPPIKVQAVQARDNSTITLSCRLINRTSLVQLKYLGN